FSQVVEPQGSGFPNIRKFISVFLRETRHSSVKGRFDRVWPWTRYGWPGAHQSKRSRATDVVVPRRRGCIYVMKHRPATGGRTITAHSTGRTFPRSSPIHPKGSLSPT